MPIDYDDMMQSGATGLAARYDEKDVMLYALGVGMGRDPLDEKELPFVYENNGLKVIPTFASVINRGEAPPERQRTKPPPPPAARQAGAGPPPDPTASQKNSFFFFGFGCGGGPPNHTKKP